MTRLELICGRLHHARLQNHMPLAEVGELIRKHPSAVWKIENGKQILTVDVFIELCYIYDLSPAEVILTAVDVNEIPKAIKDLAGRL